MSACARQSVSCSFRHTASLLLPHPIPFATLLCCHAMHQAVSVPCMSAHVPGSSRLTVLLLLV